MWIKDFWKSITWVPLIAWGLSFWADKLLNNGMWTLIWDTKALVDSAMWLVPAWAWEMIASWVGWISAWLLSNKALKDLWLEWTKFKNGLRYVLNTWAVVGWYMAGTAAAPYLAAWAISYWIWKHGWDYWIEWVKRWVWTVWGLTWWLVKWLAVWTFNSAKAWLKWEQKLNPVIN